MTQDLLVGIEAFGFYIPKNYLPIEVLANERNIDPAKLTVGLGLKNMAVCSPNETVDYMAAQAIIQLNEFHKLQQNRGLDFDKIDRVYLGTESSIDSAKPTITFAKPIIEKELNVDTSAVDYLDMTFACIGAVDALLACLDYVQINPDRQCIIVASDEAKYDVKTGGEYTQGAGAVALLISSNPKIMSINSRKVGVDTSNDFDFYKPLRKFTKTQILEELKSHLPDSIDLSAISTALNSQETQFNDGNLEGIVSSFWNLPEENIKIHRKQPVFDGKLSNNCYQNRIERALERFQAKSNTPLSDYEAWIFHLPYAYQGRRIAVKYWWNKLALTNPSITEAIKQEIGENEDSQQFYKLLSKHPTYKKFVADCIEPSERASSEIGNMYTASILMAAISHLVFGKYQEQSKVLFLAYGSGSKAKVFSGEIQNSSSKNILLNLYENQLFNRNQINYSTYLEWHRSN